MFSSNLSMLLYVRRRGSRTAASGALLPRNSGEFLDLRKIVLRFTSFRNAPFGAMKTAIAKIIKRHFDSREIARCRARTGVAIC
jgi:hypothetical protein